MRARSSSLYNWAALKSSPRTPLSGLSPDPEGAGRSEGGREGGEAFVTHFEVMRREKEISAGTKRGDAGMEGRNEGRKER